MDDDREIAGAVVITGNPMDGMAVHGPFDTLSRASEWAETLFASNIDWWAVPLYAAGEPLCQS